MFYLRRAALRATLATTQSSTEQQLQERIAMAEATAAAAEAAAVDSAGATEKEQEEHDEEDQGGSASKVLHLSLNRRPVKYAPVSLQSAWFESGLLPPCRAGGAANMTTSALMQQAPTPKALTSTNYPNEEEGSYGRKDALIAAARRARVAWFACQHPKPSWPQVPLHNKWQGRSMNTTDKATRTRPPSSSSSLKARSEDEKPSSKRVEGFYLTVYPSAATLGGRTGVENKAGPLIGGAGLMNSAIATSKSTGSRKSGSNSSSSSISGTSSMVTHCRSFYRPPPPPYFDRIPPPEELEPLPTLLARTRGGSVDTDEKSSKSTSSKSLASAALGGGSSSSPGEKLSKRMTMKAAGAVTSSLLGSFRSSKGRSNTSANANDDGTDSKSASSVSSAAAAVAAVRAASPVLSRSSRNTLSASTVASPKSAKKAKGGSVGFQGAAAVASTTAPPLPSQGAPSSSSSSLSFTASLHQGHLAPPVVACGWGHGRHLAGWPAHSSLQPRRAWWQPSVSALYTRS